MSIRLNVWVIAGLGSALASLPDATLFAQVTARGPFERLDRNGDGRLTRDELPENMRRAFDRVDTDKDGFISRDEDAAFRRNRNPAGGAQAPGGPKVPDTVRAERDLAYAGTEHPRQRLDLYLPKAPQSPPVPLIAYIHGGGWQNGDKAGGGQRVIPFVATGEFAGASIGYRLSGDSQWPAQIHDCKAALRWLRAHADEYGYDPNRIAVMGSSAGGHLVAMLGVTADVPALEGNLGDHLGTSTHVSCVVDYFGPADMLTMGDFPSTIDHNSPNSAESKLLGAPVQEIPDKAREASPQSYISAGDAPFLILHGTDDKVVPYQQSVVFDKRLREQGVESILISVEGGGHGFGGAEIDARVRAFLERHLLGRKVEVPATPIPAPTR